MKQPCLKMFSQIQFPDILITEKECGRITNDSEATTAAFGSHTGKITGEQMEINWWHRNHWKITVTPKFHKSIQLE